MFPFFFLLGLISSVHLDGSTGGRPLRERERKKKKRGISHVLSCPLRIPLWSAPSRSGSFKGGAESSTPLFLCVLDAFGASLGAAGVSAEVVEMAVVAAALGEAGAVLGGAKRRVRSLYWRLRAEIRRQLAKGRDSKRRFSFHYDPFSYALNFDDGCSGFLCL